MPYDEPDPQDPMLLVGVSLPGDAASRREMVCGIAEEFARMGFDEARILDLFRQPFYVGAHAAYAEMGEAKVLSIIRETLEVWGRVRFVDRDAFPAPCGLYEVEPPNDFEGVASPEIGAVPGPERSSNRFGKGLICEETCLHGDGDRPPRWASLDGAGHPREAGREATQEERACDQRAQRARGEGGSQPLARCSADPCRREGSRDRPDGNEENLP